MILLCLKRTRPSCFSGGSAVVAIAVRQNAYLLNIIYLIYSYFYFLKLEISSKAVKYGLYIIAKLENHWITATTTRPRHIFSYNKNNWFINIFRCKCWNKNCVMNRLNWCLFCEYKKIKRHKWKIVETICRFINFSCSSS